jgi:hypothetical protein
MARRTKKAGGLSEEMQTAKGQTPKHCNHTTSP